MEDTINRFIFILKNNDLVSIFCVFFSIRRTKDDVHYEHSEYLGENIPFNIIDKIAKSRHKAYRKSQGNMRGYFLYGG